VPMPIGDPGAVDIGALRVLDVPTNGMVDPEPALRDAQVRAAGALAALGARVEPAAFEGFKSSFWIWGSELATRDADTYRSLLGQGMPINRLVQLGRWLVGRSPHTLPSLGLAVLEDLIWLLPGKVERALADGAALREQIVEALGDDGVMLFPSYPRVAPRHNVPILQPFYWVYTAIFNALELPVTQVPLGLDERGLPLGVQVVARHGNDHLGLAVALALEEAFGGWVEPDRF
jgi:fatty acid amide hydrolase 2